MDRAIARSREQETSGASARVSENVPDHPPDFTTRSPMARLHHPITRSPDRAISVSSAAGLHRYPLFVRRARGRRRELRGPLHHFFDRPFELRVGALGERRRILVDLDVGL